MRKILLLGLILQALFSEEAAQELLQCSAIFESKKAELKDDLRRLSEKEQSLRILQTENARLLDEKTDLLNQKEKEVEEKLKNLAAKEEAFKTLQTEEKKRLKNLIEENEGILREIKQAKDSKIGETYSKMKDSKSALILENLPTQNALEILMALKPQELGKILAKMDPKKAAALTELWQKPPKENKEIPKTTAPTPPIAFGTQFALSLIPLGGYVKLKGMDKEENGMNETTDDSYAQKSPFQKLWILFGGAFFNFLFAILVYFFLALGGEKVLLPVIGDLDKNALEAGLLKGDKILSINHKKIASFREIRSVVARARGELVLEIERNHQVLEKRLTPKIVAVISDSNDPNEMIRYKAIGIKPDMQKMGVVSYSLFQAFEKALSRFKEGVVLIVDSLRRLIMGSSSVKELSGVVGIVGALSHANSLSMLLLFGAFLSINLGILNLLPIPALDGAQMLGVVFKNIFHITLPTPIQNALWLAGVGFLVFIMFLGLFNDLTRLL